MIASLAHAWRECPDNKSRCFSDRCRMGLCQRLMAPKPQLLGRACPLHRDKWCYDMTCRTAGCQGIPKTAAPKEKPHFSLETLQGKICPVTGIRCKTPYQCLLEMGKHCPSIPAPVSICHLDGKPCESSVKCETCPHGGIGLLTRTPDGTGVICPTIKGSACHLKDCISTRTCKCNMSTKQTETTVPIDKSCHFGLYRLGKLGSATIWIGREAAVGDRPPKSDRDFSLIISLIGGSWPYRTGEDGAIVTGNPEAQRLFPEQVFRREKVIPFFHINWPDYGVPPLDKEWWLSFAKALAEVDGEVAIYCMGGHGRTGTMASILAVIAGWSPKGKCPVTWLRSKYCHNVVESDEQADYIENITDCKITAICSYEQERTRRPYPAMKSPKGNVTVKTSKGKPDGMQDGKLTLSKNAFKKWAKKLRRDGSQVPTIGELDDGEMVTVAGSVFQWCLPDQKFMYLGPYNPQAGNEIEPEKPTEESLK